MKRTTIALDLASVNRKMIVVVVVTFHIGIVHAKSLRRTSKDGELGGLDTGNKTKSDREIEDDVAVTT